MESTGIEVGEFSEVLEACQVLLAEAKAELEELKTAFGFSYGDDHQQIVLESRGVPTYH